MLNNEQKAILEEARKEHMKSRRRSSYKLGVLVLVLLGVYFGFIYWSQKQPIQETSEERHSRLVRCSEVWGKTPTFSERVDGENAGICSGFSQTDIDSLE